MTRRRIAALSLCLAAALALPACGSDGASSGESAPSELAGGSATTAAAAATTVAAAADRASTGTGAGAVAGGVTPVPAPPSDRKVVVTVTLDLEVADVGSAGAKVTSLAEAQGGYVQRQQATFAGDRPSSTLVLKVPPDRVTALLTSVAGLGTVTNQTQDAEDVTAQFVDLESRIATAKASVARVREFLDRTQNVNELASLEAELTRRETELEQLVGARNGLAARAEMATVTIGLLTAGEATAPVDEKMTPGRALERGVDALVAAGTGIAVFFAFLLPWVPLALLVLGVVLVVRRRARRRAAAAVVAAAPPASTPERETVDA